MSLWDLASSGGSAALGSMFARKGGSVDGPDGAWSYVTGCSIRWNDFVRDDLRSAEEARRFIREEERRIRSGDRRSSSWTVDRYNERIDSARQNSASDEAVAQVVELLQRKLGPTPAQLTLLATSPDLAQIVTPSRQRLWKILPCLHGLGVAVRAEVRYGIKALQHLNDDPSLTLLEFEKSPAYAQQSFTYELVYTAYKNVEDFAKEQGALSAFIESVNSNKVLKLSPLDKSRTNLAGLRRRRRSRKSRR